MYQVISFSMQNVCYLRVMIVYSGANGYRKENEWDGISDSSPYRQ